MADVVLVVDDGRSSRGLDDGYGVRDPLPDGVQREGVAHHIRFHVGTLEGPVLSRGDLVLPCGIQRPSGDAVSHTGGVVAGERVLPAHLVQIEVRRSADRCGEIVGDVLVQYHLNGGGRELRREVVEEHVPDLVVREFGRGHTYRILIDSKRCAANGVPADELVFAHQHLHESGGLGNAVAVGQSVAHIDGVQRPVLVQVVFLTCLLVGELHVIGLSAPLGV